MVVDFHTIHHYPSFSIPQFKIICKIFDSLRFFYRACTSNARSDDARYLKWLRNYLSTIVKNTGWRTLRTTSGLKVYGAATCTACHCPFVADLFWTLTQQIRFVPETPIYSSTFIKKNADVNENA